MRKVLSFAALVALLALGACQKTPAPEGSVSVKDQIDVPFYGGALSYVLESNCDWEITSTTVDVVPIRGTAGTTELTVTVPGNTTASEQTESFTVKFTNADGISTESVVKIVVPAPSLNYGGVDYRVVYMPDGKYWMVDNLRYVPDGMTVSSDPSDGSGLWYPYSVDGTVATALTDDESVAKYGYLYGCATAFGVEVTEENYKNLEGVQGICPEGWHIPTRSEWFALCGDSNKGDDEESAPDKKTDAVFFDAEKNYASVVKANDAGFNFVFAGCVFNGKYQTVTIKEATSPVEEWWGSNAMNYILASTGYTTSNGGQQMFALMSSFTKTYEDGRLSLAYSNITNGVSVRCVKD